MFPPYYFERLGQKVFDAPVHLLTLSVNVGLRLQKILLRVIGFRGLCAARARKWIMLGAARGRVPVVCRLSAGVTLPLFPFLPQGVLLGLGRRLPLLGRHFIHVLREAVKQIPKAGWVSHVHPVKYPVKLSILGV